LTNFCLYFVTEGVVCLPLPNYYTNEQNMNYRFILTNLLRYIDILT
jgi:hypothetical protein